MLNTLRNALPIVAAALGRKFGVEVGVGGHDACTDGKRIQIPDVPDDPASRDLAWGYLAHESAHVRNTDFAVYEQAAREGPLQAMLQNRIDALNEMLTAVIALDLVDEPFGEAARQPD